MTHATLTARHPTLGACFEELLSARFLPQRWSDRIWSRDDLPNQLQRCVRELKPEYEWRAYGDADRIFFAIARLRKHRNSAASAPSLEVYFLDTNAAVYCAGVWERDAAHGWWLDSVVELSYNTENGWWLEAMADTRALPDNVGQPGTASPLRARDRLPRAIQAISKKESP